MGSGMSDRRKTGQPKTKSRGTVPGRHLDGRRPEEETFEEKGQATPGSVGSGMGDHRKRDGRT